MSNVERDAFRSIERARQESLQKKAELIVQKKGVPPITDRSIKEYYPKFYGEKYPDDYSQKTVERDMYRAAKKKKRIEAFEIHDTAEGYGKDYMPHALECMLKKWLDDGKTFGEDSKDTVSPKAENTHFYDDGFNGIDVAKILKTDGKTIPIGFDVTTSCKEDVITKKLKPFWDKSEKPYGLSELKYFVAKPPEKSNYELCANLKQVPRFVIGVNRSSMSKMLSKIQGDNIEKYLENNDADANLTRFKILCEVSDQLYLYGDKLLESTVSDKVKSNVESKYDTLLGVVGDSIAECVRNMTPSVVKNEVFGDTLMDAKIPTFDKDTEKKLAGMKVYDAIDYIKGMLRDKESPYYDATFDQIITVTEKISNGEIEDDPEDE